MSDIPHAGVLYTEHSRLRTNTPLSSLWSYESRAREEGRHAVAINSAGSQEYWLDRTDPLLNSILPGTAVSIILNFMDPWAYGRTLMATEFLPRACVTGPFTEPRLLRVGRSVRAIGAVLPSVLAAPIVGVEASELVNRIVPLEDLWPRDRVERLLDALAVETLPAALGSLRDQLLITGVAHQRHDLIAQSASALIMRASGRVSVDKLAAAHHLSRQQFSRRFQASAGMPPKLFARITRFQALVHALLSNDVAEWAVVSSALGFYDQAHMINEFRGFTGRAPTIFFRPHRDDAGGERTQVRGRPSEWFTRESPRA